jgi:hypothetical protein
MEDDKCLFAIVLLEIVIVFCFVKIGSCSVDNAVIPNVVISSLLVCALLDNLLLKSKK